MTYNVFDLLRVTSMADEQGIASSDYNQVMNPDQCHRRAVLREHDVISRIDHGRVAIDCIVVFVPLEVLCNRAPASYVIPIELCFDDQHAISALHDRVIERNAR